MKTESLPFVSAANATLAELRNLSGNSLGNLHAGELLFERARLQLLSFQGSTAPGGSCHLLPCRDAMLVINLPRQQDWEQVPAWLYSSGVNATVSDNGNWYELAKHLETCSADIILKQAYLLDLAVARADIVEPAPADLAHIKSYSKNPAATEKKAGATPPLIIDLSSLWAGPLCSHLLNLAGFRVIKVESASRPDGARYGNETFYRLLNQNKESITLDFKSETGIADLRKLIACADIIIESSRPRALRDLGIDAEHIVKNQPGLSWISITGHGRYGDAATRIGFGDDAAAAAGLSLLMREATGDFHFVGDAIADPLTGIHSALAAMQTYLRGGNELVSLSLRETTSHLIHQQLNTDREPFMQSLVHWKQLSTALPTLVEFPEHKVTGFVASLGQHNLALKEEFQLESIDHHHAD